MPWNFYTASGALKNAEYVGSEFPAGTIVDFGGTSAPTGWLLCDGSTVSRSTYSSLFNVIGTAYGAGDGSTTFKIPDSTGKIIYATPGLKLSAPILPSGSINTADLANGAVTAAKIASGVLPTYVTSLPASPTDGQEVYYAASATNGVIWHLRYRSGSGSSYKWEFVGGPELIGSSSVAWITNNTSYSTSANISGGAFPTVTVPLAGDYDVTVFVIDAFTNVGAGYTCAISYQVGGTAASDNDGITFRSPGNSYNVGPMEATSRKTAISASTVLSMAAKIDNGNANLYIGANSARPAGLRITPVRVG